MVLNRAVCQLLNASEPLPIHRLGEEKDILPYFYGFVGISLAAFPKSIRKRQASVLPFDDPQVFHALAPPKSAARILSTHAAKNGLGQLESIGFPAALVKAAPREIRRG